MNKIKFTDDLDIKIVEYFENNNQKSFDNELFNKYYNELKKRYLWLNKLGIDPRVIHLEQNHKEIYEIFDNFNQMLNSNNIEYYYTSGILSYLLANEELQRYHHDLDVFINMEDLSLLESICEKYGFSFYRQYGSRNDGTKRIMLKMIYDKIDSIPITIFMFVRKLDNSIIQNDYYTDDKKDYVEKIFNSKEVVDLSFSNTKYYHNNIPFYSITPEALYLSKMSNRIKDQYDCIVMEKIINKDKLDLLSYYLQQNKENEIIEAYHDEYYDYIFNSGQTIRKVLKK